jgi:uncharacterized protein YdaU (DUF1376 family)
MPLYIGDYLRKTMHLTIDQHGAYLMLIMACWCEGGTLPGDDRHLASICHVPLGRWQKLRPAIERFFQIDDTGWHNTRVTEELAKAAGITEQRRNAGRASVRARAQQTGGTSVEQALPADVQQLLPTNAQQMGRPSPLGEGLKGTEGALGSNLKTNLPLSSNETNSARARDPDENQGFLRKFEGFQGGRYAPLPASVSAKKRDQLVQKLIRFSHATLAEPNLSAAITGLCGGDQTHDDQWWLDHLDKKMRDEQWDDAERISA